MELQRLHATVRGRVQGVGFRFFVGQCAAALKISGWVRNRLDGSVEFVAEGDKAALDRFLAQVKQGPPGSRVDSVESDWQAAEGRFPGFTIRPTE